MRGITGIRSVRIKRSEIFPPKPLSLLLIREDPRYYTLGSGGFLHRTSYAISRLFITRTDSGGNTFNFSEIGGNLMGAGVSDFYYPGQSRERSEKLADKMGNADRSGWDREPPERGLAGYPPRPSPAITTAREPNYGGLSDASDHSQLAGNAVASGIFFQHLPPCYRPIVRKHDK